MCGIAGWIHWEGGLSGELSAMMKMTETLTPRGPDAGGYFADDTVLLGHRRLAVVDIENGKQPMHVWQGDKRYTIVYNGELYNTQELKRELTARGYTFQTTSDTEVLLISYLAYGEDCVKKLNGIFAFAIYDKADQKVFFARDRIGVKPLFYAERGKHLFFASELKALLAHPMIEPAIDEQGLAEIFIMAPARTPGVGVFRGVKELRAGHAMVADRKGVRTWAYWSLTSHEHTDTFEETARRVRELVIDTAARQLVADVPVGTFLSGGLDSSILTALSAEAYRRAGRGRLTTFSVDYIDNDKYFKASSFQPNSDAVWAKSVAEHFDTDARVVMIDHMEMADALEDAVMARDLVGMADIDASLYLFCREIKKTCTVALSGECADEVFGGYPWFYREEMLHADTFPWSPRAAMRLDWLSPAVTERIDLLDYLDMRYREAVREVPYLDGETDEEARMRKMFYLNLTRWMPTLLDRKDRMSMAFGLEVRVPFCDHRLVEYLWNVPWQYKNYNNREKGLLRYAMAGVLPEDILWRKKSPYPKTHHPEYAQCVKSRALGILADPNEPASQLFDHTKMHELARLDLSAANIPWFGQLMGAPQIFAYIIQVNAWLKHYHVRIC